MPPNPLGENEIESRSNGNELTAGQGAQLENVIVGDHNIQAQQLTLQIFQAADLNAPRKWRVALAHYAQEPLPRDVRDQVQKALTTNPLQEKFALLPDGDPVAAGAKWNRETYLWMGLAHIVVLLVSPSALASDWFDHLVFFLSGRAQLRALDKDRLVVIPVLFDISPEDFKKHLAHTLEPDETKWIQAQGAADVIKLQILARLTAVSQESVLKTAMEKMAHKVASRMKNVSSDLLRETADKLGLRVAPECKTEELRLQVAGALWYADYLEWEQALNNLGLEGNIDPIQVLELIAPSWVNPLAALPLMPLFYSQPPGRAIALQGTLPEFAGVCFLRRVNYAEPEDKLFLTVNQLDDANPRPIRVAQIKQALKAHFGNTKLPDAALDAKLQVHLNNKPLFVIVASPEPDEAGLDELLNEIKPPPPLKPNDPQRQYSIVFVFLSTQAATSVLRSRVPFAEPNIKFLPEPQPDPEMYAKIVYDNLYEYWKSKMQEN